MTAEEQAQLDMAFGAANAAWGLARLLLQIMAERNIIPPSLALETVDVLAMTTEDRYGPLARTGHAAEALRLYQQFADDLVELPSFRAALNARRS